jgi:hypothetical protein
MKKLIFILSFALLGIVEAKAQSFLKPLQSDQTIHKAGLDTSTATAVMQIIQIPGQLGTLTIQAGVTKLTGAPVGSVKLYGSTDGIKYDFVTTSTDTLAVANVAGLQVKTWKFTNNPFQYYKMIYKPTGSQTSTVTTSALGRK